LVSAVTAASRVLGVARDSVIAACLGATHFNDIFQIAFTIPNLARRVLGEGALSAFIVPIITGVRRRDGEEAAWRSTANAFNLLFVITLAITVVGCFLSKPLFLFYGGTKFQFSEQPELIALRPELLALGSSLTRIMFPFLMVITLMALLMGVLHSLKHFFAPAIGSIILNVVLIATALFCILHFQLPHSENAIDKMALDPATFAVMSRILHYLAWAVMVSVVLRLLVLFPPLIRRGFRWRPLFDWREPGFRELMSKMPAGLLATVIAQISISVSLNLANWCGEGSVTYLIYSQRLIQLPMALFSTALSTALLPQLSSVVAEENRRELHDLMGFAMRAVFLISLPATIGLMVLGRPIVQVLFPRGAWSAAATQGTALALFCYAAGLMALDAQRIFSQMYYAQKDMMTPVKYMGVAMVVNIILNLALMNTPLGVAGIALASSLAAMLNAWLLWRGLLRRFGSELAGTVGPTLLRTLVCAVIMGAVCGLGYRVTESALHASRMMAVAALTLCWVAAGLIVYAIATRAFGLWDVAAIRRLLKR